MLLEAEDKHFAWMLGEPTPEIGLRLPAGGVDASSVLEIVRRMAVAVRAAYGPGCWMIVVDGEVVGLCSYKRPPDRNGVVEIGYGVAPSCRQRGYATQAVTHLLEATMEDHAIHSVVAETAADNLAWQRVLQRNGFVRDSTSIEPDGKVILWRHDLSDFRR
jgi:RimJ/RimL family protein N-acetyltransferase